MNDKVKQAFSIKEDKPSDWFEPLYAGSSTDGEGVPWANMTTHPAFKRWLALNPLGGEGKTALVVGCGMGDDAIELEALGFDVTAFDVADSAIAFCKKRFPDSDVNFLQADLLQDQPHWTHQFDFVLEIYTVQALPPKFESTLIQNIADFVAPNGQLLVVAEVKDEIRDFKNGPPWLLTPNHIDSFVEAGLTYVNKTVEPTTEFDGAETYVSLFSRSDN